MSETRIPAGKSKVRAPARFELEPRDFEETARFYRRLGFQVTIKGDAIGKRVAELKAGEVRIRLREGGGPELDRRRSAFHRLRLVLAIASFEEFRAEVQAKGIETADAGPRAFEVTDPNGVRLLLEEAG